RVVIADQRKKRDGRAIEEIGLYHPKEDPSRIEINSERAQHWLSVGAQPSEPVQRLLELTGDWQKFKGLPAPEPLKVAAPRADKHAAYEAEAKAAAATQEAAAEKKAEKKKPAKKATKAAKAAKADTDDGKEAADDKGAKGDKAVKSEKKSSAKAEGKSKSEESAGAKAGSES
ncbi:MAG: 30S ribosomal protein S16, partial [Micromonosporaceae bacterium]